MGIVGKKVVLVYDQRHIYKVIGTGYKYGLMTITFVDSQNRESVDYIVNVLFVF